MTPYNGFRKKIARNDIGRRIAHGISTEFNIEFRAIPEQIEKRKFLITLLSSPTDWIADVPKRKLLIKNGVIARSGTRQRSNLPISTDRFRIISSPNMTKSGISATKAVWRIIVAMQTQEIHRI